MQNTDIILINFLPYKERVKKEAIFNFGLLTGKCVGVFFVIFIVIINSLNIKANNQQIINDTLTNQNKQLDVKIKEIAGLKEKIQHSLARRGIVETLQTNRAKAIGVINYTASLLPPSINLTKIDLKGEHLTISGKTISNAMVANYITALEGSSLFKNTHLIEIRGQTDNRNNNLTRKEQTNEINSFIIKAEIE